MPTLHAKTKKIAANRHAAIVEERPNDSSSFLVYYEEFPDRHRALRAARRARDEAAEREAHPEAREQ